MNSSSSIPWRRPPFLLLACGSMLAWSVTCTSSVSPIWGARSSLPPRRAVTNCSRHNNRRVSRWVLLNLRCGSGLDDDDDESAGVDVDEIEEEPSSSSTVSTADGFVSTESMMGMEIVDGQEADTDGNDDDEQDEEDGSIPIEPNVSISDSESSTEEQPQSPATHKPPNQPHESTSSSVIEQQSQLCAAASTRRAEAKLLHDTGKLHDASLAFHEAASLLREAAAIATSSPPRPPSSSSSMSSPASEGEENSDSLTMEENDQNVANILEECATCRLHEALCLLKRGDAEGCVEVCTQVLGDGVVPPDEAAMDDDDNEKEESIPAEGDNNTALSTTTYTVTSVDSYSDKHVLPSHVRARAHLRRAKARLALDDFDGALEDARQSAFMGDRNAVAFYGRLMREGKNGVGGANNGNSPGLGNWGDTMQGNSLLEGMLGGNNPFLPSNSDSTDFSSSLLSSLLSNGSGSSNGSPMGILGELLTPQPETNTGKFRRRRNKKKKNGIDSLAKSLLSNVMKRMENEETQETICKYLHSTNTQQIMQYAALAGVPMKEESAQRLVRLASGITPGRIRKSISNVKRGLKVVRTLRKILKVIDKYKSIIVLMMLFFWVKSAILEPYPVDKRQAKKLVQKAAIGLVTN